jgi:two-component system cell cycle response regulator
MRKDKLTGLFSRSHFDQPLRKELIQATDQDWPLNIAFIDLDYFKQVDDNFAHKIGDVILRSIAGVILGLPANRTCAPA